MTEDALIRQHARLAYAIARDFYFPGADHDDVDQEALFGLLKAIRCYDQSQDVPFAPFAALCIRRHLIVSVKAALRGKHSTLTGSARVIVLEGKTVDVLSAVADPRADPVDVLEHRDTFRRVVAAVARLSDTERAAVVGIADGRTYAQITARTGLGWKTIDNAAQRGRRKLRAAA